MFEKIRQSIKSKLSSRIGDLFASILSVLLVDALSIFLFSICLHFIFGLELATSIAASSFVYALPFILTFIL